MTEANLWRGIQTDPLPRQTSWLELPRTNCWDLTLSFAVIYIRISRVDSFGCQRMEPTLTPTWRMASERRLKVKDLNELFWASPLVSRAYTYSDRTNCLDLSSTESESYTQLREKIRSFGEDTNNNCLSTTESDSEPSQGLVLQEVFSTKLPEGRTF